MTEDEGRQVFKLSRDYNNSALWIPSLHLFALGQEKGGTSRRFGGRSVVGESER